MTQSGANTKQTLEFRCLVYLKFVLLLEQAGGKLKNN